MGEKDGRAVSADRIAGTLQLRGHVSEGALVPSDQFDVSLQDEDLLEEVELIATVMVATTDSDEHLSQAQIDDILGVVPAPRTGD